jgi:hypothetical protein
MEIDSIADLGCLFRNPDPIFFYPGSRFFTHPGSRIQESKKAPGPGSGAVTLEKDWLSELLSIKTTVFTT